MATVADVMVDTLHAVGVKRIYGVVGDSLNGITDALMRKNNIQWVHTRHEEAAALAAGAEAQLTGELAVCAGSCGPGNLHLINGLYDSHRSGAPVLAIAAHIGCAEIGTHYFQETHPQSLFQECSCFCEQVSSASQLPQLLALAIQAALTHRGVAVIIIPGDIALHQAVNEHPASWPRQAKPVIMPNIDELQKMADILNESRHITLMCGYGCRDARDELMQLCNLLKSPMVHALRGKESLEYENPYDVGMTGFIGFSSGYYAMEHCDTLVLLGTNFPYRQFYPTKARVIQIDICGDALGRRCPIELGVVGDVKDSLRALMPLLKEHEDVVFLNKALAHYHDSRKQLDRLAISKKGDTVIHPQYLAKLVSNLAADDAIFTCDVGTPTIWAARYLKMNGKRRLLGSFNHGTMANALSQGIGAQSTYRDRQVIALCGDGGFTMLMGDLITLLQEGLPVKIVIVNNGELGFVALEMIANGLPCFGTELKNPNFGDMANAMGIYGRQVKDPSQLENTLREAFLHPGPAVVDVISNRLELSMPPAITLQQIKGFGLYTLKAIMSGSGDEVLELLKSNFWR